MRLIDADVLKEDLTRFYDGEVTLPSAQPERKISNKEWIDFLVFQFDISRTSAKEMLHGMMRWKKEDNFKKQFGGEHDE